MGLSIAYKLGLPAATDRETVMRRVEQLRERARQLPFALVTELMVSNRDEPLGTSGPEGIELEFWYRSWANLTLHASSESQAETLPESIGFVIYPGKECEPAAFGMAWSPPRGEDWNALPDQPFTWCWQSACKTQYASIVSSEHFLSCHTSLVALLDAARELGFDVTVFDEGGYWESRDADRLLAQVETMNQLMAGFAGMLHDEMGDEHSIDAAIFSHPDFERLETKEMAPPPEH
jgi:hypothetical protein